MRVEPVIAAVQEDPVVPAARAALAVPEDLVGPAARAASVVPESPVVLVALGDPVVPENPVALAAREDPAAQVVPESPAVLVVQEDPVAQENLVVQELAREAAQGRTRSATAAHHPGQVPVLRVEDLAVEAETTREPAAIEAAVAWVVAG